MEKGSRRNRPSSIPKRSAISGSSNVMHGGAKSQNESLSESIAALSKIETQESKTPTPAHSRLKVARSDP